MEERQLTASDTIRRKSCGCLKNRRTRSELPEVLGIAMRILVLRDGSIRGEMPGSDATEEKVARLMTGVAANS